MTSFRFTVLATVLLFTSLITLQAQTADEIVQKHLAAIGGADKWKKINSLRTTSTFISGGQEVKYTVTVLNKTGIRKDFTYVATGLSAFVIITQTAGWSYIPLAGLKAKPEPMPAAMVAQSQNTLTIQSPLIDYKAKGYTVKLLGKQEVKGVPCYKLALNTNSGTDENIFIDASTYYHIQSTQTVPEHEHDEEEIIKNYTDFKKLPEGIMYAMTRFDGPGVQSVKKVEVNIPVDTMIFTPVIPTQGTK